MSATKRRAPHAGALERPAPYGATSECRAPHAGCRRAGLRPILRETLCICRVFCAEMSPEVSCSLHLPRETCNLPGACAFFSTGAGVRAYYSAVPKGCAFYPADPARSHSKHPFVRILLGRCKAPVRRAAYLSCLLGRYELLTLGGAPPPHSSRQMHTLRLSRSAALCVCRVFCAETARRPSCLLRLPRETRSPSGTCAFYSASAGRVIRRQTTSARPRAVGGARSRCSGRRRQILPALSALRSSGIAFRPTPRPVESARSVLRGQRMRV